MHLYDSKLGQSMHFHVFEYHGTFLHIRHGEGVRNAAVRHPDRIVLLVVFDDFPDLVAQF